MTKKIVKHFFVVTLLLMTLFLILACCVSSSEPGDYYGFMDTGEGSYIIFKLGMFGKTKDIFVLTDGVLGFLNQELANDIRAFALESNFTKNHVSKIASAFINYKGTRLLVNEISIKKSNICFETEQKMIEKGLITRFEFAGTDRNNKINGEMTIYYQNQKYPQYGSIEFQKLK